VGKRTGSTPSWKSDVQPLVTTYCAGCHMGGNASGGSKFDTYADTQVAANCDPSKTVGALMAIQVTTSAPCGGQMPMDSPALSAAEQQVLADWASGGMPESSPTLPCDQDASGHLDNGEACYHTASYPAAGAGQPCGEDTDCDACDPDTGCDSANCVPTFNKQCWKQDRCGSGADAVAPIMRPLLLLLCIW